MHAGNMPHGTKMSSVEILSYIINLSLLETIATFTINNSLGRTEYTKTLGRGMSAGSGGRTSTITVKRPKHIEKDVFQDKHT